VEAKQVALKGRKLNIIDEEDEERESVEGGHRRFGFKENK